MTIEIVDALNVAQLGKIRQLEQRCDIVDGGRLKLEWGSLEGGGVKRAALAYGDGKLLGYLGRYQFGVMTPEFAGMVDPDARRQGIGTKLLEGLLAACAAMGDESALLVVPHTSIGGRQLAASRGTFDHAEHSLILNGQPADAVHDPAIEFRVSTEADFGRISELIEEGFGHPARPSSDPKAEIWVVVEDDTIIGTVRLIREGTRGYVGGFVIAAARRGQGVGRDILQRACLWLRQAGMVTVELEVAVTNDRAIGLYTSLGFAPQTTEDYYLISTPASGRSSAWSAVG